MTKKQLKQSQQDQNYNPFKRSNNQKLSKRKFNTNSWTIQQEICYIQFLTNQKQQFLDRLSRSRNRVFVNMSIHVKKRTPEQCRSHHQKMKNKYDDINAIIEKNTLEKTSVLNSKSEKMAAQKTQNSFTYQNTENFKFKQFDFEQESVHLFQIEKTNSLPYKDALNQKCGASFQIIKISGQDQEQEQSIWNLIDKDAWNFQNFQLKFLNY